MSVPFSNTHLRVPRGFGTILEGLAREVLRDQPEDIPQYAALYFDALLKQREDSGMDPADWAAKLEDRFYNNHAFKATGASPEKEPAAAVTITKEKSDESQTEDESSHSAEASNLSATQPNVSEEVELTESTGEEDEKHDITEEHVISTEKELSDEHLFKRLRAADAQSDELSGTEDEDDPTTFGGTAGKQYSSPTDLSSFRGISNVDVCAQELGTMEDEGGEVLETAAEYQDIVDSEEEKKTEVEELVEVYPYSGLADVDVCATELVGAERTVEGSIAEDNTLIIEEESSKPQPEETVVQDNQQVAENQVEKAKEEEGRETETPYGGTHESLTHIEGDLDSNVIPKEDSFVEISFEDVPEAQQNTEVGEKQPAFLNTNILEMQQEEESEEVSATASDQNISGTQDHDEPETVGAVKELNPEGEEMESQHEASDITKEKVETADSNSNDSEDDETGEGVKTISSSHQPTSEAEAESPEHETDLKNEETEEISEREFHQNESNNPDVKEEDKTDTMEGKEEEDMQTEGHSEVEDQETNDGTAGNHTSEETETNISTAAMEAESETFDQLPEENEESQRTLVESQPEDEEGEKQVTSKERTSEAEGLVEEGKIDSAIQGKSDAMCEESSISHTQSADRLADEHQGEESELGSEQDTTEPEGHSGDKQEDCSRPQEEEDIMDIPLDDPEANRAAAKIQAGFRGHMTRKKMKPEDKAEGEERQEDRGQ